MANTLKTFTLNSTFIAGSAEEARDYVYKMHDVVEYVKDLKKDARFQDDIGNITFYTAPVIECSDAIIQKVKQKFPNLPFDFEELQDPSKELKRVIIMVREPNGSDAGAKQTRIDVRDEIIQAAISLGKLNVIETPADMAVALIECTEGTKQKLRQDFPDAVIADEKIIPRPAPQYPKPQPPKFKL